MPSVPRRRLLQLCGGSVVAALAGCRGDSDGTATRTQTDTETATAASTPTETTTRTDTATETDTEDETRTPDEPASVAWSVDALDGPVTALYLPGSGPTDEPTGPLYAVTEAGAVARIEPSAGDHRWTATVRGQRATTPNLTVAEDGLHAVSETYTDDRLANHVERLDPETGAVEWTFEDRAFLRVREVVDDLVILAGEYIAEHPDEVGPNVSPRGDGRIYGVDRESGTERWRVEVPELRGVDAAAHGVYALETRDFETNQLRLLAFDRDGTERWRVDTGTVNPGAPAAAGEDLLLAGAGEDDTTDRGGVGRYDPADGSLRWSAGDWERGPGDVAWLDDIVYAGAYSLLVLAPDGTERYRIPSFGVPDVPATPETLYNDGGSTIPAADRAVGEIRWRYRPEGYDYTHLRAVLADHVAVDRGIGEDRTVVLLSETSGEVVGTFDTAEAYRGAVGAGDRLFLGVGDDVVAYDLSPDLG